MGGVPQGEMQRQALQSGRKKRAAHPPRRSSWALDAMLTRSGLKTAGRACQNIGVASTTIRPNEIMG
jgi:hypothetical protein